MIAVREVPDVMKQAILAAEDERFYQHGGVDYLSVARAALANLSSGTQQGAGTITMQVARNFFLTREKTVTRKLREVLLAWKIEANLSKDEILELYVNQIFLGQRAYGFAAASQIYFAKPLKDVTAAEAAMLAGLPKAPSTYNPCHQSSPGQAAPAIRPAADARAQVPLRPGVRAGTGRAVGGGPGCAQSAGDACGVGGRDGPAGRLRCLRRGRLHARHHRVDHGAQVRPGRRVQRRAQGRARLRPPPRLPGTGSLRQPSRGSGRAGPGARPAVPGDARCGQHRRGGGGRRLARRDPCGAGVGRDGRAHRRCHQVRRAQPGRQGRRRATHPARRRDPAVAGREEPLGREPAAAGGGCLPLGLARWTAPSWRSWAGSTTTAASSTTSPRPSASRGRRSSRSSIPRRSRRASRPATIVNDAPFFVPGDKAGGEDWEPKNYDGKFEGPMRLRTARGQVQEPGARAGAAGDRPAVCAGLHHPLRLRSQAAPALPHDGARRRRDHAVADGGGVLDLRQWGLPRVAVPHHARDRCARQRAVGGQAGRRREKARSARSTRAMHS